MMKKLFLRTLLYSFLTLSLLLGGVVIALQNSSVKERIVKSALTRLEKDKNIRVTYKSVEGLLPFYLKAKEVTLYDEGQKWITASELKVSCLPWHLLHFRITLPHVEISDATVYKKDIPPKETRSKPAPWQLEIGQLAFHRLHFGEAEALQGFLSFSLDMERQAWEMDAYLFPQGSPEKLSSLNLAGERLNDQIKLQASLKEDSSGTLRSFLGIKEEVGINATVVAVGPKISFKRLSGNCPTESDLPIKGQFNVALTTPIYWPASLVATGNLTATTDRSLSLSELDIATAGLRLTGTLNLDETKAFKDTSLDLTLNLDALPGDLAGNLQARTSLQGPLDALQINWETFGEVNEIPLRAFGEFTKESSHLLIQELSCTLPYTNCKGKGSFNLSSHITTGNLTFTSEDFSFLSTVVKKQVSGEGDLKVRLFEKESVQAAEMEFTAKEALFGDIAAQKLAAIAQISCEEKECQGYIKVEGEHIFYHDWQLSKANLFSAFDTEENLWTWELKAHSDDVAAIDLITKGSWRPTEDRLLVHIETLAARIADFEHVLTEPVDASFSKNHITLPALSLGVRGTNGQQGYILADITLDDMRPDIKIRVNTLPLDGLSKLIPALPMVGTLSGEARLLGDQGQLTLSWERQIKEELMQGRLTGYMDGTRVQFTSDIFGIGEEPLQAMGRFQLKEDSFAIDTQAPIDASLSFHGDIAPILRMVATDFTRLTGDTAISFTIKGTMEDPSFTGYARIRQGTYESLYNGVTFYNVYADLEAKGDRLLLNNFSANDDNKGSISGAGIILLDPAKGYPYDISLNAEEVLLARLDFGRIASSGVLRLSGNNELGTLSGTLDISAADFTIPKKLPKSVPTLDVTYVNGAPKSAAVVVGPEEKTRILLDLDVDVPGDVHLEGRGLKSEWKGSFKLSGEMSKPEINGQLKMAQGEFFFSGRPFTLTQGTLAFDGTKDKTSLQVHGELQLPDTKVIVILKGPMQNPKLFFYSNPSLPEKEILSLILFNKHTSEITAFQGVQLAQTISDLSGNSIAPDVLGNIRRSIGLDRLDLDTACDSNELSIQAGKYLSRGVYVMVSKSINSESNSVGIEAQLTPSVKIQGQASGERGSQLSLKWSRDY